MKHPGQESWWRGLDIEQAEQNREGSIGNLDSPTQRDFTGGLPRFGGWTVDTSPKQEEEQESQDLGNEIGSFR